MDKGQIDIEAAHAVPRSRMVRVADYKPPDFLIDAVELVIELDAENTIVRNKMRIRRARWASADAPLRLDGRRLSLVSVKIDQRPLTPADYALDEQEMNLRDVGEALELEICTNLNPRQNKSARGLFELAGILATQCEAEGFRQITYFPDRPDVLARYRVTLKADQARYPVLLSNGNLIDSGHDPDGRHWTTWDDPYPKPSYIFAIVAGRLSALKDRYHTKSGRAVDIAIYSDEAAMSHCRFAMKAVKRSLAWDEETFGLEYDLDRYNLVALRGWAGAMENKGLNIFERHGIVASPETNTDDDHVIIERIIGHEQFHNWTGNRVTCRDWFQLSLKEGLTRLRDQLFVSDKMGGKIWRIENAQVLRRNQFPEDDSPAAHPIQPTEYASVFSLYTATVYDKGAEVIRMAMTLLGWEEFRKGFDLYIARHDGQSVTTEEFVAALEDASGRDLRQFRLWYSQTGRPRLSANGQYHPETQCYRLTVRQSCPVPAEITKPFVIPILAGLVGPDGDLTFGFEGKADQREALLLLTEQEQTFVFSGVACKPVPSLLRDFSAPVSLETDITDQGRILLMKRDSNPFTKWDAAQTLYIGAIRKLSEAPAGGDSSAISESLVDAFGAILADAGIDDYLKSQLITIPDEPMLSEGLAHIDLDALMTSRDLLHKTLVDAFEDELLFTYHSRAETGPYSADYQAIGRRRLKNRCLALLISRGDEETAELCLEQFRVATNMTDQFEALMMLSGSISGQREEAFAAFYDRWHSDGDVINKWFNARALSRAPDAAAQIIALTDHPLLDPDNLARNLAFYGAFFRQNRVAFHDRSGAGYELLADRLIAMDRLGRGNSHYNMPQINRWRRYDPERQEMMRAALQRIWDCDGISDGLRDNVGKALQG